MGFGHRVYHTEDPRANVLRKISEDLGRRTGNLKWFEMSKMIADLMIREKKINANVDFYSASAYYVLGIPIDLYPLVFAASRISGWTRNGSFGDGRSLRSRRRCASSQPRRT